MNSAVEKGLLAFLVAKLTATSQQVDAGPPVVTVTAASVSGKLVSLHCNIGTDPMPEALARIVIGAEVKKEVGFLHMGEITFLVSTPMKVGEYDDAKHRAIVAAVKECFPDIAALRRARAGAQTPEEIAETQAELDAGLALVALCAEKLLAEASLEISSESPWNVVGWNDSVGGERWQAKMTMRLGLHETA